MAWTAADQDELAALRWGHSWLRCKLALLKLEIALRAYDPNQPRVPAGNPDGGQWTGGNVGSVTSLPATSVVIAQSIDDHPQMKVQEFVSAFCQGRIQRRLPGQFLDLTILEVLNAAKSGDTAARTCIKLLSRPDYRK